MMISNVETSNHIEGENTSVEENRLWFYQSKNTWQSRTLILTVGMM